jgi:hypothetical protein
MKIYRVFSDHYDEAVENGLPGTPSNRYFESLDEATARAKYLEERYLGFAAEQANHQAWPLERDGCIVELTINEEQPLRQMVLLLLNNKGWWEDSKVLTQ